MALAACAAVALPTAPTGVGRAGAAASPGPSPSAATATPAPASPASPTAAEIARLLTASKADDADASTWRDLGFAYVQRVRETADPSLYASADAAFERARALDPDDPLLLVGIGGVQLGRHQFAAALETGRAAVALDPDLAAARAVVVDALVELGRYDEADEAAVEMLAVRADLTTLARVSYVAELGGNLDLALEAMRQAAASPSLAAENEAYVKALLGNLLVATGDRAGARARYENALALVPDHAPSLAGLGRLAVGDGDLETAIARFARAAEIVPLPEYVIALGDAQLAAGHEADAKASFDLARVEIRLFEAAGVVVDQELALFEADHGDPHRALELAELAYAAAPTVRAADAVAWALHRLGRHAEANEYATEALRFGIRDPLLRFHAGAIAAALGDERAARTDLEIALATDPGFSALGSAEARRILNALAD